MKTSLVAALLTLAVPTTLLAQTTSAAKAKPKTAATTSAAAARPTATPNPAQVEARAKALTDNMQKALALTPQQVEKVQQINLTSVRGVETARQRYGKDMRKMASVVEDIGQSRLSMLKEVLSAQQFDKYQRKREEKMGVPSGQAAQGNAAPGLGSRYEE